MSVVRCSKCKILRNIELAAHCPICYVKLSKEIPLKYERWRRPSAFEKLLEKSVGLKEFISNIPNKVLEEGRAREVVSIRRKMTIILKDKYHLSFPQIAKVLGYRDHTTPLHLYHNR